MPLFDLPTNGKFFLDLNGASKHLGTEERFNERNPGFGLSYQWKDANELVQLIKLGQYLNSLNEDSKYVGYGIKKRWGDDNGWHVDVGALGGLISGYNKGVIPAILPQMTIGNGAFGLNILAAPPIPNVTPATLMFSTEIPLK